MGVCHQVAHREGHVGDDRLVGSHLLWSESLIRMLICHSLSPGLYCSGDWTRNGGWKSKITKPATMPYEESYPKKNPKWERTEASQYYDNGFSKSKVPLQSSTTMFH